MVHVKTPTTQHELDSVRALMRRFVAWHRERHAADIDLVNSYFDPVGFDAEVANLPGAYAAPAGRLLLATLDGVAAGCVALRPVDAQSCEMKRMFVLPALQGRGVGRALATRLIEEGAAAGYRTMRLHTSIRQLEAQSLYRSLGFVPAPSSEALTPAMRAWLVFMSLDLSAAAGSGRAAA